MKLYTPSVWLAVLTALFGIIRAEADTVIDFNAGNELATSFVYHNATTTYGTSILSQVSFGGLGNSGAVDVNVIGMSGPTATYTLRSYNFSQPGVSLYCSIFFKYQTLAQYWFPIILGFTGDPDTELTVNNNAMGVALYTDSQGTGLEARFGSGGAGASIPTLTPGNWYRLSGTFLNQPTTLKITATLDNFGPTGASLLNQVHTVTVTSVPDGNILTDPSVWLAFQAHSGAGTDLIDNLTVIPEPGAAGLSVLAGGLLLWRRRRMLPQSTRDLSSLTL